MARIRQAITMETAAEKVFPFVWTGRGFAKWWAADVTETPAGVGELGSGNGVCVEIDSHDGASRSRMAL